MIVQVTLILLISAPLANHVEALSENYFNFRVKTLDQLNMARQILAAGDVAKIYEIIKTFGNFFGADLPTGLFGPAANMYKLKWSRRLEKVAFEYMENNENPSVDITKSIHYKDHIGFLWMGDLLNIANYLTDVVNISIFDKVEVIIMVLWMLASMPKSLPLGKGEHYGPAEALFAERYEIGCTSSPIFSVCFLDPLPYQKLPFKIGPACTVCSTYCEFWQGADKTIEEGDLCVPPIPHQEKMLETVTESMTDGSYNYDLYLSLLVPIFLILILHISK
ncbi:hypothetical protein B9Z55_012023 [Caenorhabditis nigoni]|uniref:Uncharacterized protein n=1 Tax=Caenorhabditis nigoni TaxID=1611254 RepID=A0A2G5TWE6_9PELO|nr:hypothetical protein B9Z55_012023 [Caenorhabditis nigoni]